MNRKTENSIASDVDWANDGQTDWQGLGVAKLYLSRTEPRGIFRPTLATE